MHRLSTGLRTGLWGYLESVQDLGRQPTTWTGTGCAATGGSQQRAQQSEELGLQPGKDTACSSVDEVLRLEVIKDHQAGHREVGAWAV